MRIIEVRDGFIKLETTENLALSAFLQIDDVEKKYVAQIVQLKKAGEIFVAYAKILFLYDGTLEVYDKSLPSVTSNITNTKVFSITGKQRIEEVARMLSGDSVSQTSLDHAESMLLKFGKTGGI